MDKSYKTSKLIPIVVLTFVLVFFVLSFLRGNFLVQKSEKELNSKKQIEEAQAKKYSLKEIDSNTGELRWQLTAKESTTENNLQGAFIKDIQAQVFKNGAVVFELTAPMAKANIKTKEINLFGDVVAKDKGGKFLLKSNKLALGMGTSIEAQNGFNLVFYENNGTIKGEKVLINDDQTKILIAGLKEADLKDLILSGNKVLLEKNLKGDVINIQITDEGKITLKNQTKDMLSASTIKWKNNNEIEANTDVVYTSEDKIFKADYLLLKQNGEVIAKNRVEIIHENTKCQSNNLIFKNKSQIVLTGNPIAFQEDKKISADKIIYNINTKTVEATGNVKTTIAEVANR